MQEPRLRLAGYVRMGVQGDALFLGFGSIQQQITDRELWRPLILAAECWGTPHSSAEVTAFLVDRGIDHQRAIQAVGILRDGGFLAPVDSFDWSDRYSRHLLHYQLQGADPAQVQAALASAHVVIVGCGGIGNLVAAQLACSGIGRLTLVDDDRVELTNLTRQLMFTERDVDQSKVAVLAQRLTARNSNVTVTAVDQPIHREADLDNLPENDLMVVSADMAGIVETTNRYCVERGITWINVGYVNDIAVWGPLVVPGTTGCWACRELVAQPDGLEPDLEASVRRLNAGYRSPSYGPVNMVASAFACLDIVRHLGGLGHPASYNQRIGLWSQELSFEFQDCSKSSACPLCSART